MSNRRGVTLVELLIVIIVLSLVSVAVGRVILTSLRVSQSQLVQADLQSNVRTAGLVLPMELREIGYDSNTVTDVVTSDLTGIAATNLHFRVMRGIGYTCGTPTETEFRIRKPPQGFRDPVLTDGFLLFVESDENLAVDDQWVPLIVLTMNDAICGAGDKAIALTVVRPKWGGGDDLGLSQIKVGGPIRYYEDMYFGSYVGPDGRTWLGARSISLGEVVDRPIAGPFAAGTAGIWFRYYARDGTELDPTTANPADVRTIDILLQGETAQQTTLAGTLPRSTGTMTVRTRVALRNTLSH